MTLKIVVMPKLGTTMREGTLMEWHKNVGDPISAGEVLLSVESNKAAVDVESAHSGWLVRKLCEAGETRPIGEPIGLIGDTADEDASGFVAPVSGANAGLTPAKAEPKTDGSTGVTTSVGAKSDGKIRAVPKARSEAKKLGVDLAAVRGSGPNGTITVADVERVAAGGSDFSGQATPGVFVPPPASALGHPAPKATPLARAIAMKRGVDLFGVPGSGVGGKIMKRDIPPAEPLPMEGDRFEPLTPMRRVIAENMYVSLQSSAQACHRLSIDMTEAKRLRNRFKADGIRVSFGDIIAKAVATALMDHPGINVSINGERIVYHRDANIGFAVALDEGLIVPNVKGVQKLSIPEIAAQSADLVARARSGNLKTSEYRGGTFTVTNLGMFDIEDFVAIINPPEAGILAVGKIIDKPVVREGEIVIRPMMTVCLTYDHLLVDGAPAAAFLKQIKEILEAES